MKKIARCAVAVAVTVLALGARPAGASVVGYAIDGNTLYSIDLTSGTYSSVGSGLGVNADFEGLTFDDAGQLYAYADWPSTQLYTVNTVTGNAALVGELGKSWVSGGLAFDHVSETLYLLTSVALATLDRTTGAATLVGATGLSAGEALAYDNGMLFASENGTESLYGIDPSTGDPTATLIGPHGQDVGFHRGMSFDDDGILWLINDTGGIYTVDPSSGAATLKDYTTLSGLECLAIQRTFGETVIPEPSTVVIWSVLGGLVAMARCCRRRAPRSHRRAKEKG
jgi:hypothetical protein